MKPFPWAALGAVLAMGAPIAALSYCYWHGIGPREWYAKGTSPSRNVLHRRLAISGLPVSLVFLSVFMIGLASNTRPRVQQPFLNGLVLAIGDLGVVGFVVGF